jgi:hypothetical protein
VDRPGLGLPKNAQIPPFKSTVEPRGELPALYCCREAIKSPIPMSVLLLVIFRK